MSGQARVCEARGRDVSARPGGVSAAGPPGRQDRGQVQRDLFWERGARAGERDDGGFFRSWPQVQVSKVRSGTRNSGQENERRNTGPGHQEMRYWHQHEAWCLTFSILLGRPGARSGLQPGSAVASLESRSAEASLVLGCQDLFSVSLLDHLFSLSESAERCSS